MSLYTINSKFPIVSFFRITRLGSAALASTTHDEYILFHIGNDNIFSVRFSFEINYNFFLCYFPYGFVAPSTIRQPEQEENVIKKCCTTGSVVFSHFFLSHTLLASPRVFIFWKKAQLASYYCNNFFFIVYPKKPPVHELFLLLSESWRTFLFLSLLAPKPFAEMKGDCNILIRLPKDCCFAIFTL